ncbi:HAD-IB family hydrolase [Sporosarcina sp. ACRSL]|uniref:HAD family hydrolase n=1 Tax=Sporosarcina sp. ACRSL TaxID=2918215 RepID=UPI001EF4B471|nr:HAD-IB family hydrolase [Sporosarcina sp. ACRSL]MCG7344570.1 HAD-IB family hydrolase [Sporosarcina sp. ACRSL]
MKVAIFDFDGTLYSKETFTLLMDHLKEHPTYRSKYKTFFREILPIYIGYKMKIVPEAKMRERSMQIYANALNSLTKIELEQYFGEMKDSMRQAFNEDVVSKVRQHRNDDIHVMLVSGAYTPLLHAVTDGIEFDTVIGTDIPFTEDGAFDHHTSIYHIQGKRKTEKVMETLEGNQIDWEQSYAYGDSYSDLPVLELVGNPVAVKPDERLKKVAEERNWTVL